MDVLPPRLNLLVLRSSDIQQAAAFYRLLGLEFVLHSHGGGPEHYASGSDGFVLEIYPLRTGQVPSTGTRLGFAVQSVDELVARLVAEGATVVSPPSDSPWGRRAVVKDYDGHAVELLTPAGDDT